jgi:hypothetical protein
MVKALLDGRKTQTRRVIKGEALNWLEPGMFTREYVALPESSLVGAPGDRLWVKESFRFPKFLDTESPNAIAKLSEDDHFDTPWRPINTPWCPTKFEADDHETDSALLLRYFGGEWGQLRLSIFMPRWASRITLEIESVRVERVQEISEADAAAEGVEQLSHGWRDYLKRDVQLGDARWSFQTLWDSINAERGLGWDVNPFVWVIQFRGTARGGVLGLRKGGI